MSVPDGSSILIVLMGSVGDVARGLALVNQLKAQVPEVKITWLVEPKSRDLVALHSGIDEIILFRRGEGIGALMELRRSLSERRFDIVLDLQRHFKSGFFSKLSRGKRIIGFNARDAKEFNWLFSSEQVPAMGEEVPKLQHYLAFLKHLGLAVVEPLDFGILQRARAMELPEIFPRTESPKIGVVLGSAWESKDWVAEGYDGLLKILLERTTASILLLGDKSKMEFAQKLCAAHRSERVVSLAGITTLAQLAGVISNLTAACGPDSGPGHIAAALGVPYVALFGATDPVRTAPFGSEDLAIQSEIGCSPCYRRTCPGLGRLCMRLISPDSVAERLETLLA